MARQILVDFTAEGTFSRTSAATRWDGTVLTRYATGVPRVTYEDGLKGCIIEPERTNVIEWSNDLTQSHWLTSGSVTSRTYGVAGPSEALDATRIVWPAADGWVYNAVPSSQIADSTVFAFSFWARSISGSTTIRTIVNHRDGTFGITSVPITTSWARYVVYDNFLAGGSTSVINFNNNALAATVDIFGVQVEAGSYATSLIETSGAAATRAAEGLSATIAADTLNREWVGHFRPFASLGQRATGSYTLLYDGAVAGDFDIRFAPGSSSVACTLYSSSVVGEPAISGFDYAVGDTLRFIVNAPAGTFRIEGSSIDGTREATGTAFSFTGGSMYVLTASSAQAQAGWVSDIYALLPDQDNSTDSDSASWAYRVEVEGWGIEACSHSEMEKTYDNGRQRIAGLNPDGLIIDEDVDPVRVDVQSRGLSVRVVDRQDDDVWTQFSIIEPEGATFLTADMNAATTSISVLDTSQWSVGTMLHLGTECLRVTGISSGVLATVARAQWGTQAQCHYTEDGDKLRRPAVSKTYPVGLEGRRVRVYRYIIGTDALDGDGTCVWRGIVATEPMMSDSGTEWSFDADPLTSLFEQDLGSDMEDPVTPRGIYYPRSWPLWMVIQEYTASDTPTASHTRLFVRGFFETNAELCEHLNAVIDPLIASWNVQYLRAVPDGDDDWHFVFKTGSTVRRLVVVANHPLEGGVTEDNFPTLAELSANTEYAVYWGDHPTAIDGVRAVPRGGIGGNRAVSDGQGGPDYNLYIDGVLTLVSPMSVTITRDNGGTSQKYKTTAVDTAERKLTLNRSEQLVTWYSREVKPTIDLGRIYVDNGTLADFRDALTTLAPTLANIGGCPYITGEDLASWATTIDAAAEGRRPLQVRDYIASKKIQLSDLIQNDCRLYGVFPALDADAKVGLKRLRVPNAYEGMSVVIDDSSAIDSGDGVPKAERNALGTVNQVVFKTGYDPKTDEHKGQQYRIRDVESISTRKASKELEIAPMSRSEYVEGIAEATAVAAPHLSVLGRAYIVVTVPVHAAAAGDLLVNALVGTACLFTSSYVPDPASGIRGINSAPALVIGRYWDLLTGKGSLKLLIHASGVAGYAPDLSITGTPANVSGNTWDMTVSTNDPLGVVSLWPAELVPSEVIAVGDKLDLIQYDTFAATPVQGTVVQWNSATSIRVTFNSAVTPTSSYYLRTSDAAAVAEGQRFYCYLANDSARIEFGTPTGARRFA